MGLKRRTFLQQMSLTLAALGLSESGLLLMSDRYRQVLAQPTTRKLALLVGINQYPEGTDGRIPSSAALAGCVTDVQLQRELLVHRFGFQPSDVLMLTDAQATRQNIESAFLAHLKEQARPGDVVVFHFSGYGSCVEFASSPEDEQISLVPVDSLPATAENPMVNDLLEETFRLLLRSLQTEQIVTVLDASYADPGVPIPSHLRVRSRSSLFAGEPNPEELALQEQLLSQVKSSREEAKVRRRFGQMPGIVLAAAGAALPHTNLSDGSGDQAFEARWNGFSAGLFTYALTQQLWAATPANGLQVVFNRSAGSIEQLVGPEQAPRLTGHASPESSKVFSTLVTQATPSADGVVVAIDEEGKVGQLWLGGFPLKVLENYGVNSLLTLIPSSSLEVTDPEAPALQPVQLQLRSRDGLRAKAQILASGSSATLQVGQLVQEAIRVLPRHVNLTVALDASLERIERVDATSAFSAFPQVSLVNAGEQPADYLFGRLREPNSTMVAALPSDSPAGSGPSQPPGHEFALPPSSYGLFSLGRVAIPTTIGEGGEAIKTAVHRLTPQVKALLAAKLLRLTVNENSSQLGVRVNLQMVAPKEQLLAQRATVRATWPIPTTSELPSTSSKPDVGGITLPIGSRIRYQMHNYSERPVYVMVLGLDSGGSAIALYAKAVAQDGNGSQPKSLLKSQVIKPGETLTFPQTSGTSEWIVQGPPGSAEIFIICSQAPLTKTLAALEGSVRPTGESQQIGVMANPLTVAQAVLEDLHQASIERVPGGVVTGETLALDVRAWATFGFNYQVANKPVANIALDGNSQESSDFGF